MAGVSADAKTYAQGLLEASDDHAATWHGLRQLRDVVGRTPILKQLLTDAATRSEEERDRMLNRVLAEFDPLLRRFVALLLADGELDQLPAITDQYEQLFKKADNIMFVTVETPHRLSAADRQDLTDRLAKTGRRPLLTEKTNRRLIGGLRVIIDDIEYDHSLSGALARVEQQLIAA